MQFWVRHNSVIQWPSAAILMVFPPWNKLTNISCFWNSQHCCFDVFIGDLWRSSTMAIISESDWNQACNNRKGRRASFVGTFRTWPWWTSCSKGFGLHNCCKKWNHHVWSFIPLISMLPSTFDYKVTLSILPNYLWRCTNMFCRALLDKGICSSNYVNWNITIA